MIYKDLCGERVSMLGFGTMRLPTENGEINTPLFEKMVDLAIKEGVNYFDTAWPYHAGLSEIAIGKALAKYPRESYFLANKYPGHQIFESYNPAEIFEEQLRKCGVEYFDFYLLHNVYENSLSVYLDEKWGILDYFKEQKRKGRIKHLGFSSHARPETLKKFLEIAGNDMELCLIQLNWMDWTLQNAKEKVEILNSYNIPILVMEPVRGGKLCSLNEADEKKLKALRPDDTIPAWGFKFLHNIQGVSLVLSGMSNMEQMQENIKTFATPDPLNETETSTLFDIAEGMKNSVPCTSCRYCTEGCPQSLNIPELIAIYNDISFLASTTSAMALEFAPKEKLPSACVGCQNCTHICPQNIDIPKVLQDLDEKLKTIPKWADICREREEAAKKLKGL